MGGAVDFFLKLDGLDGETVTPGHTGEINILSWNWGATQGYTAYGKGGALVSVSDISFTAKVSKASTQLLRRLCDHLVIKTGVLTCRKAGKDQQEYLVINLESIMVSSYRVTGGSGADEIPTDSFSLNFAKIDIVYKMQKSEGNLGGANTYAYMVGAVKTKE
jgi:type VI secretion system secreted protein Hcp